MEKVSFAYVEKLSNYERLQLGSGLNNTIHNNFMATVYKEASLISCIRKFQS